MSEEAEPAKSPFPVEEEENTVILREGGTADDEEMENEEEIDYQEEMEDEELESEEDTDGWSISSDLVDMHLADIAIEPVQESVELKMFRLKYSMDMAKLEELIKKVRQDAICQTVVGPFEPNILDCLVLPHVFKYLVTNKQYYHSMHLVSRQWRWILLHNAPSLPKVKPQQITFGENHYWDTLRYADLKGVDAVFAKDLKLTDVFLLFLNKNRHATNFRSFLFDGCCMENVSELELRDFLQANVENCKHLRFSGVKNATAAVTDRALHPIVTSGRLHKLELFSEKKSPSNLSNLTKQLLIDLASNLPRQFTIDMGSFKRSHHSAIDHYDIITLIMSFKSSLKPCSSASLFVSKYWLKDIIEYFGNSDGEGNYVCVQDNYPDHHLKVSVHREK